MLSNTGRSITVGTVALCTALSLACTSGNGGTDGDSGAARDSAAGAGALALSRCYRSDASVLLGPSRGGTSEGTPPGWIRLESPSADTGAARLVDSGGAGLHATWNRIPGDSIHLAGFDDFLRVEMRLVVADSQLRGTAVATSDAALERDTAGRLHDLRRDWDVTAQLAPCDSMPALAENTPR